MEYLFEMEFFYFFLLVVRILFRVVIYSSKVCILYKGIWYWFVFCMYFVFFGLGFF